LIAMQIKAAVARTVNGPFSLEALDLEEPRFDEVLVRIVATGICHTDISMRDHKIYPVPQPVVLGHEGAGIVERVGPGVTTSPLSQAGERVHYFQGQSSFATYALCRDRNVVKVPKQAPLELLGPLGCGVMTGAGAVINSMAVGVGASIAVFGTGSVGLSGVMAAKLLGAAKIIAVDKIDQRLDLACKLGATHAINPDREDVPARLKQITAGVGVDYTLETTASMRVLRLAIDALAPRGTCGFVGGAPAGMEVTIDVEHVMTGGRTIRGVIMGDANPDVFLPRLIELFLGGRFPIDRLATFYPFEDINRAAEDALSGKVVKPILRMSGHAA
jgi:aryl-alcohol dehydrogenase